LSFSFKNPTHLCRDENTSTPRRTPVRTQERTCSRAHPRTAPTSILAGHFGDDGTASVGNNGGAPRIITGYSCVGGGCERVESRKRRKNPSPRRAPLGRRTARMAGRGVSSSTATFVVGAGARGGAVAVATASNGIRRRHTARQLNCVYFKKSTSFPIKGYFAGPLTVRVVVYVRVCARECVNPFAFRFRTFVCLVPSSQRYPGTVRVPSARIVFRVFFFFFSALPRTSSKMPVFHTKTIESILEPVAQQVNGRFFPQLEIRTYCRYSYVLGCLFFVHDCVSFEVINSAVEKLHGCGRRRLLAFAGRMCTLRQID
jgi:hypothetical protein